MNNEELGIPVTLKQGFLLVKETLERMGIRNQKEKKFFPSCYCVQEADGSYRIYHFKELFLKEGKDSTYDDLDKLRRDTITYFLEKWGLVAFDKGDDFSIMEKKIDVLSYQDKPNYRICHKFIFRKKIVD
jgi:hypothetical protein